ncbi:hypothetical protein BBP40_006295 [Aspergillus hancockii]|nr:hypothetical protein BBP40_006295 [Aspergillus hancockii]
MSRLEARDPSILEIPVLEIYDSDIDSITIDNDPDRFQDVDDLEILSDNYRWNPAPCLLSSDTSSQRREIVDLTATLDPVSWPHQFNEGDYLTDEELKLLLENKYPPNELVWVDNENEVIPFKEAKRFVNIHFTNFCHINEDQQKQGNPKDLFCRLKETFERDGRKVSIEYLSFAEADEGFKFESATLRQNWREMTQAFGDHVHPEQSPTIVLDDTDYIDLTPPVRTRRKYTFGDGFCGAGGVSCGARRAGLYLKWAFDMSRPAVITYRLNFETAECEESDIFSFLTNDETFLRVDVSHGSPPCQPYSPAHTIDGKNDEANSACIFSCADLIRRAKPRVHTMEETNGLFERHKETFYRVIQDFIENGYSVRWDILNSMEYGVPQTRKRLIIIASGPGETLPPLPQPSHGPGLREYPTIHRAISNIPMGTPNHDVEGAFSRGLDRDPYDPHKQAGTITCGGGGTYHPSGQRNFTNRELACLQTFPLRYRFGPHETRKQIGNAVPPLLAEAVFKEVVQSLRATDEKELAGDYIENENEIRIEGWD